MEHTTDQHTSPSAPCTCMCTYLESPVTSTALPGHAVITYHMPHHAVITYHMPHHAVIPYLSSDLQILPPVRAAMSFVPSALAAMLRPAQVPRLCPTPEGATSAQVAPPLLLDRTTSGVNAVIRWNGIGWHVYDGAAPHLPPLGSCPTVHSRWLAASSQVCVKLLHVYVAHSVCAGQLLKQLNEAQRPPKQRPLFGCPWMNGQGVPVGCAWGATQFPVVGEHIQFPHRLLRAEQAALAHLLMHSPLLHVPVRGPRPASHSVVFVGCSAARTHWPVRGLQVLVTHVVDVQLTPAQLAMHWPLLQAPAGAYGKQQWR
jgi:hypothetical protein